MLRGGIPEDIRPWVRGASLMALGKPNSSLLEKRLGGSAARYPSNSRAPLSNPFSSRYKWEWRRNPDAKRWCTPPGNGPRLSVTTLTECWCSLTWPTPSTASRGRPCSRQRANTSRGWLHGPACWLATRRLQVSEESSKGDPLGLSRSRQSIHASSKPFASRSPCTLEISITRLSSSTMGHWRQGPSRPTVPCNPFP